MKNMLMVSLCLNLALLAGCQSYPKKPSQVSKWSNERVRVNNFVPQELTPYKLPPKVEYMDIKKEVPKSIVVVEGAASLPNVDTVED